MPNRRILIAALTTLALGATAVPGAAKTQASPHRIIAVYLAQDCGTGDPQPELWLRRVVELGDRAVPILAQAVRQGPPPELREEVEADAEKDFETLRALVEGGGLEAVEEQEVVRLAEELDRATYVEMRLRSLERPYRERALNALAAIDSPAARESLEELGQDPRLDPALAERAREALRGDG